MSDPLFREDACLCESASAICFTASCAAKSSAWRTAGTQSTWVGGWVGGLMDGWIDGWTSGWMHGGPMDRQEGG